MRTIGRSRMNGKEYSCPSCGDRLKRIYSNRRYRYFWVCAGDRTGCIHWYIDSDGAPQLRPVAKSDPDPAIRCPDCDAPMCLVTGSVAGDFYSCSRFPDCRGIVDTQPDGSLAPLCPNQPTHGPMRRRNARNGSFWSCRCHPTCTATRELLEIDSTGLASTNTKPVPAYPDSTASP